MLQGNMVKKQKKLNSLSKIHSFFSSVAQSKLQLIKIVFGLVHPWRRENDSHIWTPLPLYLNNPTILAPLLEMSLTGIQCLPGKWCFRVFLENFNNEINLLTHLLMHPIFTIFIHIIKLTGKWTDLNQANFYEKLMYLQCLRYRTKNKLQKKFQNECTVIETKQFLENLIYDGKKRFSVRICGRHQDQKNTSSPVPSPTTWKIP